MNEKLLNILICPDCKSKLIYKESKNKLSCIKCNTNYVIKNNVPILLGKNNKELIQKIIKSSIREGISERERNLSKLIGSDFISSNPLKRWWNIFINRKGTKTKILDVGSGSRRLDEKAINMDIELFINVDVIGDAHNIPFKDETFDTVWCEAVLEHTGDPSKVISEIYRVLKKDGYVFAVIPFIHKYHEHPNDFYRYTISGIKKIFSQFDKREIGIYRGPTSALLSFSSEYFTLFFTSNKLNRLIKALILSILFPLRCLDIILVKNKRAHELSNALYYIGKKL
ncbi:MAG: methyltransferase domain-containing protein [Candidatus Odinarchaeota archaeon]